MNIGKPIRVIENEPAPIPVEPIRVPIREPEREPVLVPVRRR